MFTGPLFQKYHIHSVLPYFVDFNTEFIIDQNNSARKWLTQAWIRNHMPIELWDEISDP